MNDNKYQKLLGMEDFRKAPSLTRMAILQNIRQLIDAGADMGMMWAGSMTAAQFRLKWGVSMKDIQERIAVIKLSATAAKSSVEDTREAWSWVLGVVKRRAIKDEMEERKTRNTGTVDK